MTRRRTGLAAAVAVALLALAGCAPGAVAGAHGGPAPSGETIALLLPESKTARYEGVDRPTFEQVVARRCPSCRVLYANADQDAARQQQQAESVLTQGAGVLVLDAVDVTAAESIVAAARERGVTVIAYDRFIAHAELDYYVSFDSRRVGQLQGEALVRALAEHGELADRDDPPGVLLVGGAPTDANSAALKAGVRGALEGTGIRVLAEYDTPDWSPDKAQEWVAGQLTQYAGRVDAVYAANDGTAGGAISAMKAAGLDPVPPVTGQDAELAAVQRVVSGDQYMTVYKAITEQARTAAELAVRVLHGEEPATTATVQGVPSLLLTPTPVTVENLRRVVVDGGLYTIEEICVQPYTRACSEAGLVGEVAR
jgi:D-xylose transport system substrate-binding protein